ncbi:isoflavone reductase family protein-like protein [Calycina marina]|uniref:Isoflavone reductase family protein-like protein n=1 Tax=Calycina marina TaxID=1763456 RepID=A0A9P7Z115_9HELO|nr:isoflavone reductase family protein-like protein [Calycina marina]
MMRIAIAGSSGLARTLAYHINETAHPFIIISRAPKPDLTAKGYQVIVVDYDNQQDLEHSLRGVNLVISTISGNSQINLIDVAAKTGVRRFCPAEFEGPPARRTNIDWDPLDRGKRATLARLRYWANQRQCIMRFTVFTCGVLYERFSPNGLFSVGVGDSTGATYQGSYLMDVGNGTAEIVDRTSTGQLIYISMTALDDVGRFVAAAVDLDLQSWPNELRMAGERLTITDVVHCAETVRGGGLFSTDIIDARHLQSLLETANYCQDFFKANRMHELMATEQRRYDFEHPNLNGMVNVVPVSFYDWLVSQWVVPI